MLSKLRGDDWGWYWLVYVDDVWYGWCEKCGCCCGFVLIVVFFSCYGNVEWVWVFVWVVLCKFGVVLIDWFINIWGWCSFVSILVNLFEV